MKQAASTSGNGSILSVASNALRSSPVSTRPLVSAKTRGPLGWLSVSTNSLTSVALGNAPYSDLVVKALEGKRGVVTEMVGEHIDWALEEMKCKEQENAN